MIKLGLMSVLIVVSFVSGFHLGNRSAYEDFQRDALRVSHLRTANIIDRDITSLELLHEGKYEELINGLELWISVSASDFADIEYSDQNTGSEFITKATRRMLKYNDEYGSRLDLNRGDLTLEKIRLLAE